jgi:Lon protease-like protein
MDPSHHRESLSKATETQIMPLYPLSATYLPAHVNHTLNNVEPRNVQMALDLMESKDRRFCAVLFAADTGRIATVGTVLRILEAEIQEYDGKIARIRLTCQAENLVEICDIDNPEAFSREKRLRRSQEYLKARVRYIETSPPIGVTNDDFPEATISELAENFNLVKIMYQLEIGSEKMPPSALSKLGAELSSWSHENFDCERSFWQAAQEWQSVCYTIQQGKQAILSTERNEIMIAAASEKGGPLKLPIHLEDLSPEVRREIQSMEVEAQDHFCKLGMDPCLDFQAIISLPSRMERITWLSRMVARERQRLETAAKAR